MWRPKCEEVRKPWVLWLKHWSLSIHVCDNDCSRKIVSTASDFAVYTVISDSKDDKSKGKTAQKPPAKVRFHFIIVLNKLSQYYW